MDDGDGIFWRSDYTAALSEKNVTDGLSHTFLAGEDLPEKNRWCSWPDANNAYGTWRSRRTTCIRTRSGGPTRNRFVAGIRRD